MRFWCRFFCCAQSLFKFPFVHSARLVEIEIPLFALAVAHKEHISNDGFEITHHRLTRTRHRETQLRTKNCYTPRHCSAYIKWNPFTISNFAIAIHSIYFLRGSVIARHRSIWFAIYRSSVVAISFVHFKKKKWWWTKIFCCLSFWFVHFPWVLLHWQCLLIVEYFGWNKFSIGENERKSGKSACPFGIEKSAIYVDLQEFSMEFR